MLFVTTLPIPQIESKSVRKKHNICTTPDTIPLHCVKTCLMNHLVTKQMINIVGCLKKNKANFNSTPQFLRVSLPALITHKWHVIEPSESPKAKHSHWVFYHIIQATCQDLWILQPLLTFPFLRNGLFYVKSFELLIKSLQFLLFTKIPMGWIGYGRCAGCSHPSVVRSWFISCVLTLCYVTYKSLLLI